MNSVLQIAGECMSTLFKIVIKCIHIYICIHYGLHYQRLSCFDMLIWSLIPFPIISVFPDVLVSTWLRAFRKD